MPKDKKDKKPSAPETTLERLQSLSLITKLSSDINAQIGINDKTLTEFIINLSEKKLKSVYKKQVKASPTSTSTLTSFHVESDVQLAQDFRTTLASNGAELPLGFVSRLLTTVWEMSPRIKRFQTIMKSKHAKNTTQNNKADVDVVGSVADPSKNETSLLSSYDHDGRKKEMGAEFPGLAVPNAAKSIALDDFQELTKNQSEAEEKRRLLLLQQQQQQRRKQELELQVERDMERKRRALSGDRGGDRGRGGDGTTRETSKRKQSNLPAWMTKKDGDSGGTSTGTSTSATKRMKTNELEMHGIYKAASIKY